MILRLSMAAQGAYVGTEYGWEWVFWVMLIFAFVCWVILVALLPETYAPVLLAEKAEALRKAGNTSVWAAHERLDWRPMSSTLPKLDQCSNFSHLVLNPQSSRERFSHPFAFQLLAPPPRLLSPTLEFN